MSADDEPLAVVRDFFQALSVGDWERVRSLTADKLLVGDADLSPEQLLDAFGEGEFERAAPLIAAHFAPGGQEIGAEQLIEAFQS